MMYVLYGILSTAVIVHLVAMALDTGQPSVRVIILCAVVIIFAGAERGRFSFYIIPKNLGISTHGAERGIVRDFPDYKTVYPE